MVAMLPAHNEQGTLAVAVQSLLRQSSPPERIIVVADNCTDSTSEIALSLGAEVFTTRGNCDKKAGALNQALQWILPALTDSDLVLVMDADCALDPQFLSAARAELVDPALGGVGGTFRGFPGGGLLGTFQRNEYARYERDVRRLRGRALVLTGTASVFPVSVLREVQSARSDGRLPDASGNHGIYDTAVLTEDNELSLALMHIGYRILAPAECTLQTEVMTTWADLGRQRLRWKRGAIENLFDYGWTRITFRYWRRQLASLIGVIATLLYLGSLLLGLVSGIHIHAFWLGISVVFIIERVVTVRARGWRQMLLAGLLVIELAFDFFLQFVQAKAFVQVTLNTERKW